MGWDVGLSWWDVGRAFGQPSGPGTTGVGMEALRQSSILKIRRSVGAIVVPQRRIRGLPQNPLRDPVLGWHCGRTSSQAMKTEIALHDEARARLEADVVKLEAAQQQQVWSGQVAFA